MCLCTLCSVQAISAPVRQQCCKKKFCLPSRSLLKKYVTYDKRNLDPLICKVLAVVRMVIMFVYPAQEMGQ